MKREGHFRQEQTVKKKKTICSIEDLSNEIFYEIFDYLDGYEIYQAFSNLNIHFDHLLISSTFLMKIEITSRKMDDHRFRRYLKSNKDHIISLDFNDQLTLNFFMKLFTIDSSFSRLESLIFNGISTHQLSILLFYLKSLSHLSALSICLTDCSNDLGEIYQMIFYLSLKYFRIAIPGYPRLDLAIPIAARDQFSSIEYLLIYHQCTLNQLTDILLHTPRLCYLNCFNLIETEDYVQTKFMINFNYLTYLAITLHDLEFNQLEQFLLQICSQLQTFVIKIYAKDKSYLDADRWKRLISRNMPFLIKFLYRYIDTIDDDFSISPWHRLINHFTTSFWIRRKWMFKVFVEEDEVIYCIDPYQESWIDYPDSKNPISHPSSPMVELRVDGSFLTVNDQPLIPKINPIFDLLQITALDIDCEEMSVSIFIVILLTLRNLTSIRISNSPLGKQMNLNHHYSLMLNQVLKNNQITKFALQNIPGYDRIDFVFNHFPSIEYFALDQVQGFDLKYIVRYILRKIKEKNISHPMTICVSSDDATYDRVEKLHHMIDSRNLLQNYTINRVYDRFYLQWK